MNSEEIINNPSSQPKDRVIRVFISSTFRDMMRERDLLVKEVFPELRRKCAKRFVTFTEVDLRWGITEAQANEGQVLPLCLAEIERSRPYFIGLLGERYGWIPDTIRPEIIKLEPWLNEHVRDRTSVTELEILHGVLNNPKMEGHAFFYFRDPAYVNDPALTADERWDAVEHDIKADVEKYGPAEATRRTDERKAKLAEFKHRIRDSKLPLAEPYANPKALAEIVHRQFDELIDRLYPEDLTPDLLVQERMAHESHAKNKLFACIDRPAHLAELNAFAAPLEHDGKGLVVTGESGGGKTALLAAWARDWVKNHQEDFLFQHYFGATPDSALPEGFLRCLLGELKSRFGIMDDIPADPEKLRNALPVWLAQTIGKGRIVLVLDGLNQVQGSEPDRRLLFLPRHFPPNVTVLASALPGPALDALRENGWAEHDLPRASEAEVDAMVGEYLKIYARTLEPELRHELVTAPGAKNPLFLRTILEELRQFGSFERLPQRVRHYLEADNPKDLFLRVLTRWQEDFDGKDPEQDKPRLDLVRRALIHLWAARQGLSEPEWLDLLGDGSQPLPRAFWTPLFLALESHLSQHAGLFAFGHDFLRQAVEMFFLPSGDMQRATHLTLADYFELHARQREMTPRKAAEWPFQLHAADAWERLEACLTDIPVFLALCGDKTKWELSGYWHPLRQRGRDMGECYTEAYQRWARVETAQNDYAVCARLGSFLLDNALFSYSEPLLCQALLVSERVLGPWHVETLASRGNLASLFSNNGHAAEAERLYRQVLGVDESILGRDHPHRLACLNNLAGLLTERRDYSGAELLYRQVLEIHQHVRGREHPETLTVLNNLAVLLGNKGDHAAARSLFEQLISDAERVFGPEHPNTLASVGNLATLFLKTKDYSGAQQLAERNLKASKHVLGPEHPDTLTNVNNLAVALEERGDCAGAQSLLEELVSDCRRVLGPDHRKTLTSLGNLAVLLRRRGDQAGADRLAEHIAGASARGLGPEHIDTLRVSGKQAEWLLEKGDYAGAQPVLARTLESQQRMLGPEHPDTLESMNNKAFMLFHQGHPDEAEQILQSVLQTRERILGPEHAGTLLSLSNLAFLLASKGDYIGAQPLYERVLATRERVCGLSHRDTLESLDSLISVQEGKGDKAAMLPLFERALAARERMFGPEHPELLTNLTQLGRLYCEKDDLLSAKPLYERALRISSLTFGALHNNTLICMSNLGNVLAKMADYPAAKDLLERAFNIRTSTLGSEHPDTLENLAVLAAVLHNSGDYAHAAAYYERAFISMCRLSVASKHCHPSLNSCSQNYFLCLQKLGWSNQKICQTLNAEIIPLRKSLGLDN